MDLNRVTLIGHISTQPEHKQLASGGTVTKTSLATNYNWKDRATGEKKEKVDFHTIVAWNKLGQQMQQYVKTGDRIYVEGRLDHRSYESKDGITKYFTDIVADKMIMLGKGKREVINPDTVEEPVITEPVTEPF